MTLLARWVGQGGKGRGSCDEGDGEWEYVLHRLLYFLVLRHQREVEPTVDHDRPMAGMWRKKKGGLAVSKKFVYTFFGSSWVVIAMFLPKWFIYVPANASLGFPAPTDAWEYGMADRQPAVLEGDRGQCLERPWGCQLMHGEYGMTDSLPFLKVTEGQAQRDSGDVKSSYHAWGQTIVSLLCAVE